MPSQVGEILHGKLARTVIVQRPLGAGCRQGLTLLTERFLRGVGVKFTVLTAICLPFALSCIRRSSQDWQTMEDIV